MQDRPLPVKGFAFDGFRTMRGLLILFVAFAIMLAGRGHHQEDAFLLRPTAPMPAVNVP
jgi:hypothetical protein